MTRLLIALALAGAVGMLPQPVPADAQSKTQSCLDKAVESCDKDFPGGDPETVAIRGYCYIIRTSLCLIFD
jgi:hypothetical protein